MDFSIVIEQEDEEEEKNQQTMLKKLRVELLLVWS